MLQRFSECCRCHIRYTTPIWCQRISLAKLASLQVYICFCNKIRQKGGRYKLQPMGESLNVGNSKVNAFPQAGKRKDAKSSKPINTAPENSATVTPTAFYFRQRARPSRHPEQSVSIARVSGKCQGHTYVAQFHL